MRLKSLIATIIEDNKMEKEYQTKDLKASKKPAGPKKDGEIFKDGNVFKFDWKGSE